jgi:glycosyltransferase involved in cell wall biosynthesis
MIKVSVIIPVYKVPLDYLRYCLDSLVAQTMRECEFIVVSDGAPEAANSICKEYAIKDSRFLFFKCEHAGVSTARNYGIDKANGKYTTFVDADDWIDKDTCEKTYSFAQENNSDLVFWDFSFFKSSSIIERSRFFPHQKGTLCQEELKIYKESIINPSNKNCLVPALTVCKLIRTSLIKTFKIHFMPNIKYGEDRIFNFSIIQVCNIISYCSESFYFYRIHQQSATFKFHKNYLEDTIIYIRELEKKGNQTFSKQLANDLWTSYIISWQRCYTHKENKDPLFVRLKSLTKIAKSSFFKEKLKDATYDNMSPISKMELFLLKHRIYCIIWVHGVTKTFFQCVSAFLPK